MKRVLLAVLGIILVGAILYKLDAWYYLTTHVFLRRTEVRGTEFLMKRIQKCKPEEVVGVVITQEEPSLLMELRSEQDADDIRKLLRSLQSATVENRERQNNSSGMLFFKVREPSECGSFKIEGDFRPENAPIVTYVLRSDSLGRVVQEIVRRKGSTRKVKKLTLYP